MRAFFFEPLSSREVLTATPVAQLAIPPAGIGGGIDHLVQVSQLKPDNFEIQLAWPGKYGVSQSETGGMEMKIQMQMQDHQNAAANGTGNTLYIGTSNGGVWKTTDGSYAAWQPNPKEMKIQMQMQDHQNAAANETQRDLIGTQRNIRNSTSRLD